VSKTYIMDLKLSPWHLFTIWRQWGKPQVQ